MVTHAYVSLIARFISMCPQGSTAAECAQALLASPLAPRHALLRYWSKDLLMSAAARSAWVEPDLCPLDDYVR
jgi:hypothetical protein